MVDNDPKTDRGGERLVAERLSPEDKFLILVFLFCIVGGGWPRRLPRHVG